MRFLTYLFILGFSVWAIPLEAQSGNEKKAPPEVGIQEHLDEYIPNATFFDKDSSEVQLHDLIHKPTIFSFVYFNCPGLCSPLLDGVAEVIDKMDLELGKDYQVITISFNPDDTPALGVAKKKNYVAQITRKLNTRDHWIWLTGDSSNIQTITNAMGFHFKREGEDFAHSAAIMIVSPKGKITRYLYGTYFLPFDAKLAIIESSEERSSPTINKVLKFCFSYDAEGRRYVFNITKITGALVFSGAFAFFLVLVFRKRKPKD